MTRSKVLRRTKKKPSVDTRRAGLIVVLSIVIMIAIGIASFIFRQKSGLPPGRVSLSVPPYYQNPQLAKPLPRTVAPAQFSDHSTRHAYEVAGAIPEILVQQPCYCGCRTLGHRSLLTCFTSDHGAHCTVCKKEAILAERLAQQQQSAPSIRRSIVAGEWWGVKLDDTK